MTRPTPPKSPRPPTRERRARRAALALGGGDGSGGRAALRQAPAGTGLHDAVLCCAAMPQDSISTTSVKLPLLTDRLRLDALRVEDAPAMFAYRSDPEVGRYQGWIPADIDEVVTFIERNAEVTLGQRDTWFQLAIRPREADTLLGDLGLHFTANHQEAEARHQHRAGAAGSGLRGGGPTRGPRPALRPAGPASRLRLGGSAQRSVRAAARVARHAPRGALSSEPLVSRRLGRRSDLRAAARRVDGVDGPERRVARLSADRPSAAWPA